MHYCIDMIFANRVLAMYIYEIISYIYIANNINWLIIIEKKCQTTHLLDQHNAFFFSVFRHLFILVIYMEIEQLFFLPQSLWMNLWMERLERCLVCLLHTRNALKGLYVVVSYCVNNVIFVYEFFVILLAFLYQLTLPAEGV